MTVLITGASSGIGLELARLYAQKNAILFLVARNKEKLETIAEELRRTCSVQVHIIVADLQKASIPQQIIEEVKRYGFGLDILINNAGFGLAGNFDDIDIQKQIDLVTVNVTALMKLTHAALQVMKNQSQGTIVNIASTAAFLPGPGMAVYYASKSFVLSFSDALAEELRSKNIFVTTICPGPTKTNFGGVAGISDKPLFNNPAVMDARRVAEITINAVEKRKRLVITGKRNFFVTFATRFLPRTLLAKITKTLQ